MQRLQRFQRLSNLPISLPESLRRAAPLQHALRLRRRVLVIQELLQKVPIEEAVRRHLGVAFPPRADGHTALGVRRVRNLGDDFAQVALERGQVERELGPHVDDDADAAGGCEEEQLGRQGRAAAAAAAAFRHSVVRRHGSCQAERATAVDGLSKKNDSGIGESK